MKLASDGTTVIWPKRFKPLPAGYDVVQLDSGHYLWVNADEQEGLISWDPYWVRRCAFAHAEEVRTDGVD